MNKFYIIGTIVLVLCLGLFLGSQINKTVGGLVHNTHEIFGAGARFLDTVDIGTSTDAGCIKFGDSDSAGITYVTFLDGTEYATTVKPAACFDF